MVFTDEASTSPGQIVNTITIRAGERVDGLAMQITTAAGGTMTFTHGGMGGDENSLTLGEGEYITSMEAHWAEKNSHTRIFYLSFGTSAGNTVSGGGQTENVGKVTAPEGYQLSGFHGQDGNEIDLLGAIWTSIKPLEEAPGTVAPADIPGSTSGSTGATVDVPVGGSTAASGSAAKQAQGSTAAPAANVAPEDTSGSDAPEPAPRTAGIKLSEAFGGPHGEQFSDQPSAASGVTVGSITVRGGERIDGLKLEITAPTPLTLAHGGSGGTDNTLTLAAGEHVTSMDINVGQKKGRTRIFYLKFTTNLGNSVEVGGTTGERSSVTAPDGYQLSGFFGRVGDEIDKLGIIWTSIEKVEAAPTTAPALTDEDIVLGELFGGPHGNAFSDINYIVLQQTTSSITIRGADRVDAVTLQVATPAERSLTHGGTGGTENTLTFGPGEYITSMEAHWDKKNKHTRIFYLSFTTNKDNTLSAGSPTDNKGTATAPEGFQLSGFFGRGGDEIDQLGAIWTKIGAKSVSLLDDTGIGAGTYGTTIRNWVGPTIGDATDKACYRKTEPYNSNEICPLGSPKHG
ncbi:hypothetical protein BBJ29_009894 [Phytophthora kernoviae]|uniref:Jacalin-type lectin domain-containing protein n=2 Tax=Phytophthora kernoviae TaxID=325452 RepID=A0A421FZY4_9STRA|nr:hypothetical protein BBJ29_009894 [Phytophthora kernoviae]